MESKEHPKGIQKIISNLQKHPEGYIIDWSEGNEFDMFLSEDKSIEPKSISVNQFWYLRDKGLIEWQSDTDQWGDRYRLKQQS